MAIYWNDGTELYHYGIPGQKWGIRRWQNPDGSFNEEGKKRYGRGRSDKDVVRTTVDKYKRGSQINNAIKRGFTPLEYARSDKLITDLMNDPAFQLNKINNPLIKFNRYSKSVINKNREQAINYALKKINNSSYGKAVGKVVRSDLWRFMKDPEFADVFNNETEEYYGKILSKDKQYKKLKDSSNAFVREQNRLIDQFIKDNYTLDYGMGVSAKRDSKIKKYVDSSIRALSQDQFVSDWNRAVSKSIANKTFENLNARYDAKQDAWFDKRTGERIRG